jgi:hypothetical protein
LIDTLAIFTQIPVLQTKGIDTFMASDTLAQVPSRQLYTPEERARRDATIWTTVQGVLAPLQFLVFLVSLGLVLRFMWTGAGYEAATISIMVKTFILYDHGDRRDLGKGRLRPVPLRARLLLGGRVQLWRSSRCT